MWSLKVQPNSEFSRSASVRRDWDTRVMAIGVDIGLTRRKKKGRAKARPYRTDKIKSRENPNPQNRIAGELLLLRGLRFNAVEGQREARFVAVGGVLVQHVLGNGLVDCRHSGLQKIARSGGVARGDGGAQTAHHRADASAVGAVDLVALKRLRRPLQNRLLFLLNFGSLSLGHLLLLLRIAQTSNVKRGSRLCQTGRKVVSGSVSDDLTYQKSVHQAKDGLRSVFTCRQQFIFTYEPHLINE